MAVTTPESVIPSIAPSKTNSYPFDVSVTVHNISHGNSTDNTIPSYNSSTFFNSLLNLMAGDDDWRSKCHDTTYGPEFTSRGAEYFEPKVTVNCYYWTHVNHWDCYVEIPSAGVSFSRHGGRRGADCLIDTLYDVQGKDANTHSLDWWEIGEINNWGQSLMVHFKTEKNGKGKHDGRTKVEKAIRVVICDRSVDGLTENSIAHGGCVHRGISKVWYNIGEKGVRTGRNIPEQRKRTRANGVKDDE